MTILSPSEGVVKYTSKHKEEYLNGENYYLAYKKAESLRKILHPLKVIGGGYKDLYDGYGYGNISVRIEGSRNNNFLISGTQTGHKENLAFADYSLVHSFSLEDNRIDSRGPLAPSSEALSHGALYDISKNIACVIHIHHSGIWENAEKLKLEVSRGDAEYGTADLAFSLQDSYYRIKKKKSWQVIKSGVIVMKGHRDGIIFFGQSTADSVSLLINLLAKYHYILL